MSGKISYVLEVRGVETAIQGAKAVDAAYSTILNNRKGIKLTDFSNVSASTKALNPELFKNLGQKAGTSFKAAFDKAAGGGVGTSNPQPQVGGRLGPLAKLFGIAGDSGIGRFLTATGAIAASLYVFRQALEIAEKAMRVFADAIQRGSKLYLDAAKVGLSTERLARARNAAGLIGIDETEVENLLLRGEFGNRRGGGNATKPGSSHRQGGAISILGELFGAYSPSQLGDLQKAVNLNKELAMALKDTAAATYAESNSARAAYEELYNMKVIWDDLKAIFEDIVALLHPIITALTAAVDIILKGILNYYNNLLFIAQAIGIVPKDDSSKFNKTSVGSGRIPVSQFEHLGFTFGGFGGGRSSADQTAKNTGQAVGLLQSMSTSLATIATKIVPNDKGSANLKDFMRDHPLIDRFGQSTVGNHP